MGLFDKKFCDVCGEKIGLLGNKKLEDGNLCKACASKLSPWFSERRHSTLADIKAQLDYREANKAEVAAFHTTRTLGNTTKVLLDEDQRKFMVTSARNLAEANPDVMSYADVTGCELRIDERQVEQKRKDKDGNEVSYVPPRYSYEYDFNIEIRVNNPYFDEINFRLNPSSIEIEPAPAMPGRAAAAVNPMRSVAYADYKRMGEEIRDTLLQARQGVRDDIAAAAAPKTAVICPCCGATTMPDANGCCEYCGSALKG